MTLKTGVKICGVTRVEDALLAAELGAAMVGMIFHPESPRCVDMKTAGEICKALPNELPTVGVLVKGNAEAVRELRAYAGVKIIQIHGNEEPNLVNHNSDTIIRAFRVDSQFDFAKVRVYSGRYILLDTKVDGLAGGTGRTFDWSMIPENLDRGRLILAGGLNPSNVADAIRTVRPAMVDVSSGIESSPGIKSHKAMRDFFKAVENLNDEI